MQTQTKVSRAVIGLSLVFAVFWAQRFGNGTRPVSPARVETLASARKAFVSRQVPTKYVADGPIQAPEAESPWQLVRYPSPAGSLAAYLTKDPHDGQRHPAIVWAHGGFGGIDPSNLVHSVEENDQSVATFQEAGLVVMMPSWRGENDNPGRFEMFLGEVDDAVAAVDYVAALPYVDPSRVYFAGHSTGGTITLLAALSTDRIRAAFSIGGMPDMDHAVRHWNGYNLAPFPMTDPREVRLRSAVEFVGSLRTPTYAFEGWWSENAALLQKMGDRARAVHAPFSAFSVPGSNHFDVLAPMQRLIVRLVQKDVGSTWTVPVGAADIAEALRPPPGTDWQGLCDKGSAVDCRRAARTEVREHQEEADVKRALPLFDAGCRLDDEDSCGIATSLRRAYQLPGGADASR